MKLKTKFYFGTMDKETKAKCKYVARCAFCGKFIKENEEFCGWSMLASETFIPLKHVVHRRHIKEFEIDKLLLEKVAEEL